MVISLHSKYPYSGKRKRGKGNFGTRKELTQIKIPLTLAILNSYC